MTESNNGNRFGFLLRALSSRNYRLFFLGQFISLMGTWLTNVATNWLVNRITNDPQNSPRMLGWVNFAWVIGLAVLQGLINAFDVPTRQSFVVKLVERREDLANGIALNSSMFNLARLIGPAAAGLLIWSVGEAWCFTIDGLSYIAV